MEDSTDFYAEDQDSLPHRLEPMEIGAQPHEGTPEHPGGQVAVIRACLDLDHHGERKNDVVVVCVGRRAGKTVGLGLAMHEIGGRCPGHPRVFNVAYAAQGHPQAEEFYEWIKGEWDAGGMLLRHKNKGQDRWLLSKPFGRNLGVRLWCWSAEEGAHDNARGKGLDLFMGDECGFWPADAWFDSFMPMLGDRKGVAILVGTAKPEGVGFAWFRDQWLEGDPKSKLYDPKTKSFSWPSECNSHLSPEFFERLRARARKRGKHVEQSEYDGKFVEDAGGVFKNIKEVCSIPVRHRTDFCWYGAEPERNKTYVAGLDWGRHGDWTRFGVFDKSTHEQVAMASFFDVDYEICKVHIGNICDQYGNPLIIADARETGAYLNQQLRKEQHRRIRDVKWSYGGEFDKSTYVTRGRTMFEEMSVRLFNHEDLKEEFRVYSKSPLPKSDGWRYEAPQGKHDDIVSMFLFAAEGLDGQVVMNRPIVTAADTPFTRQWFLDRQKARSRLRRRGMRV
jgi:hypothetical protein